jgi:hypothetical protein
LIRFPFVEEVPPNSVTVPVGTGLGLTVLTVTLTLNACPEGMLFWLGDTVTVGMAFAGAVTVTEPEPVALL